MLHFRLNLDECRDAQFRRCNHLAPLNFLKQGVASGKPGEWLNDVSY